MSTKKVQSQAVRQLGSVCGKSSRDLSSVACRGLGVTSWPTPPSDEGLPWNSPVTSVTASQPSHQRQHKRNNYNSVGLICNTIGWEYMFYFPLGCILGALSCNSRSEEHTSELQSHLNIV